MNNVDVTVVVGAYNAMPYVTKCVTSVFEQSIGLDRIELICVDDGSTDGTGAELERLAEACPSMRVVHQENSGSPAGPRNVGIEHARGRYIFFLDADDYLGHESLERMVAIADRNQSDVVLGRIVGVGGRGAPSSMFRRSWERADLFTSRVWWTLSTEKLYRKALVDRLELRFPDIGIGQDQPFGGMAYLHANAISVIADYECLYIVDRDDGQNNTKKHSDPRERMRSIELMMHMVAEHVEPGERRDALMERHFRYDLRTCFGNRYVKADGPVRKEVVERAHDLVEAYWTARLANRAPAGLRLRCELIRRRQLERLAELIRFDLANERGKDVVRDGRVYAAYPFFDDPAAGLPDEAYDVTHQLAVRHRLAGLEWDDGALVLRGHAFIDHVDTTAPTTEVVLRERETEVQYSLPVDPTPSPGLTEAHGEGRYAYDQAGFEVAIDPATAAAGGPLPRGLWDVFLSVCQQGVRREVRLGRERDQAIPSQLTGIRRSSTGSPIVFTSYFTRAGRNLTLDVGGIKHPLRSNAHVDRADWAGSRRSAALLIGGHGAEGEVAVHLSRNGVSHRLGARTADDGHFLASVPLGSAAAGLPLGYGQWQVSIEVEIDGLLATTPVSLPRRLRPVLWWRRWVEPAVVTLRGEMHGMTVTVMPLVSSKTIRKVLNVARRRMRR